MRNKHFYLFIFDSSSESQRQKMLENAKRLGIVQQIMSEVYALSVENNEVYVVNVRDEILKGCDDSQRVMVIRLDVNFTCAWRIKQENSDYLKKLFEGIYEEN